MNTSKWEPVQKIDKPIINIGAARTFSVIGDPGCEGMGTVSMRTYANALQASSHDDFILIAGDLVPIGSAHHYQLACEITNTVATKNVYVLRGNHDTGAYCYYFGLQDYALVGSHFSLIMIDNATRAFSNEGLALLGRVLASKDCQNAVIAFHIPLPNHFTGNAVSSAEFDRLRQVYLPYREKVKYFICGHVHSRFTDEVDGIPMICTGGGGAMIEDVSADIPATSVDHHIVRFSWEDGALIHRFADLSENPLHRESADPILREKLSETVTGELYAHLRYLTFAEQSEKRGCHKTAALFRALAESEYRHARNFFAILEQSGSFTQTAAEFLPGEQFEYEKLYKMMEEYAAEHTAPLSRQAYSDAAAAEKIHADLLQRFICGTEPPEESVPGSVTVCSVCGYVMDGERQAERCPVCGAPSRQFLFFYSQPDNQ